MLQPTLDDDLMLRPETAPTTKRFDQRCVLVASVLGSVLAGGVLMLLNARRDGEMGVGVQHLLFTLLVLSGAQTAALLLPSDFPGVVLTITQLAIVYFYYSYMQGESVDAHVAAGGRIESRWTAVGIALACLLVIVVAVVAGLYAYDPLLIEELLEEASR